MSDHYVVRLVTDFELLVNMGEDSGVNVGSILDVLDPRTQGVRDPVTGEDLGSIDRIKAQVVVEEVGEKLSLCRVRGRTPGGLSVAANILSGTAPRDIGGSAAHWPEGVAPRDPVRRTGKRIKES